MADWIGFFANLWIVDYWTYLVMNCTNCLLLGPIGHILTQHQDANDSNVFWIITLSELWPSFEQMTELIFVKYSCQIVSKSWMRNGKILFCCSNGSEKTGYKLKCLTVVEWRICLILFVSITQNDHGRCSLLIDTRSQLRCGIGRWVNLAKTKTITPAEKCPFGLTIMWFRTMRNTTVFNTIEVIFRLF